MKDSWMNYMINIKKNIHKYVKNVDIICEVLDSRIPISSYNKDFEKNFSFRKKVIILNKSDLSNPIVNKKWISFFNEKNNIINTIMNNKNNKIGVNHFFKIIDDYREKNLKFKNSKVKVIIIGIPNVGKSTFINSILGGKMAKCGNVPGITKGFQWFNMHEKFDLLDCPGIFYSNNDNISNFYLKITGSKTTKCVDLENLVYLLMDRLLDKYTNNLVKNYNIILPTKYNERNDYINEILYKIGKNRGIITKNSNIDDDRLYTLILNDFKNGKLGKISLEEPK